MFFSRFRHVFLSQAHALACVFFLWPALFVKECSLLPDAGFAQHDSQQECTPMGSWRDDDKIHGSPVVSFHALLDDWFLTHF